MKPKRGSAKSKTTTSDNSLTLTQMVDTDKGKEEIEGADTDKVCGSCQYIFHFTDNAIKNYVI